MSESKTKVESSNHNFETSTSYISPCSFIHFLDMKEDPGALRAQNGTSALVATGYVAVRNAPATEAPDLLDLDSDASDDPYKQLFVDLHAIDVPDDHTSDDLFTRYTGAVYRLATASPAATNRTACIVCSGNHQFDNCTVLQDTDFLHPHYIRYCQQLCRDTLACSTVVRSTPAITPLPVYALAVTVDDASDEEYDDQVDILTSCVDTHSPHQWEPTACRINAIEALVLPNDDPNAVDADLQEDSALTDYAAFNSIVNQLELLHDSVADQLDADQLDLLHDYRTDLSPVPVEESSADDLLEDGDSSVFTDASLADEDTSLLADASLDDAAASLANASDGEYEDDRSLDAHISDGENEDDGSLDFQ